MALLLPAALAAYLAYLWTAVRSGKASMSMVAANVAAGTLLETAAILALR